MVGYVGELNVEETVDGVGSEFVGTLKEAASDDKPEASMSDPDDLDDDPSFGHSNEGF